MCVIYLSWRGESGYELAVAANRDEFHDRPTEPVGEWADGSGIIAGRDLRAGGTWMGITRRGRFAALTNFREPAASDAAVPSRGALVTGFLRASDPAESFAIRLAARGALYPGFSLFLADGRQLAHVSNRGGAMLLPPGIHALSNGRFGDRWPKVERGRALFAQSLARDEGEEALVASLLAMLRDDSPGEEGQLPDTGVGRERERILSPIFISGADYGTRSSSVLLVRRNGSIRFVERQWRPLGVAGETRDLELREAAGPGRDEAASPRAN